MTAGALSLGQTGMFSAGSYTTAANATTSIGADAQLTVSGAFTQGASAILNTAIGAGNHPIITANMAALDGTLNVTGFSGSAATSASGLTSSQVTLIETTNGITGDFASVNLGSGGSTLDYVTLAGGKSSDNKTYTVGFGLTWLAGASAGNGVFTLTNPTDSFNVDLALADQTGTFSSGWNGRALTKEGEGTLILSAANTYTGDTIVNGGTLQAGIANAFAQSSAVTLASGATLDLNGFAQTAKQLSGAGNVTLGSGALTAEIATAATLSGTISGSGSVTKTGVGDWTLSGNNSYSGGTTISAGHLIADNGNALGTNTVSITNAAELELRFDADGTLANVLSGDGALNKTGAGNTTLTGVNSSVGSVSVTAGALSLGQTGMFSAGSYTTAANATTSIGADAQLTVSGAFTQDASAILNTAIGAGNHPIITANMAALDGTLNVTGFSGSVATSASGLTSSQVTLIETTNGITGDFASVNLGSGGSTLDYVTLAGGKSSDNKTYTVGFGLTWLAGASAGNGVFTLTNPTDSFNVDLALADQTGTFSSGWNGRALTKEGEGTLILSAANTYTGDTIVNGGTLQIGDGGTTGSITSDVTNDGTLSFNRADQLIFSNAISGTGSVTQDGTGTTLMTGANTYTGATRVNVGTLQQKMQGSFSSASAYYVAANATLDSGGYTTTLASLDNSGTMNFGTIPGAVINVSGNYTSHNGTIIMNVELNGDDSRSDLLRVGGDTAGTGTVKIINRGGLGAQTNEGIRIIEIDGKSGGTFNLAGDYITKDGQQAVVAGAYAYSLHEGGVSTPSDGDWYLRSELKDGKGPIINPGVPLYQGALEAMQALNKLPTLQQRVGNRYWDRSAHPVIKQGADTIGTSLVSSHEASSVRDQRNIWGRIEGAHNRLEHSDSDIKQDINTYLMQVGIDGQFYEGENGKLIGGLTGQYGNARSGIASTQSDGDVRTQAWGLGGTLTWYSDRGYYLDVQGQASWYRSDFNSTTVNRSLANGRKSSGYAVSAEAGQRIDLNDRWSLTPQAQLMWSSMSFGGFEDVFGAAVDLGNGNNLTGRIGISVDYRTAWIDTRGQFTRTSIYGIANLYQEMMGPMRISVADKTFDNANDNISGGIGAGGTYAWADDKYALYGEGSINTSLNSFAKSYAIKGTLGFKARW
ncbi:autotransporter outer membrane beta-barrel domain-containing protein [Brucella sp. H1_1004]|uniref:autotransporter outer membrane beta-barrel domain-containing protein n=1 Tax=Brucella sp. H1_1004 TaxID=3110109 RepID=UPI0039B536C1